MKQLRKSYQCPFSQQAPFVLTSRKIITKNQYSAPALSAHLMFRIGSSDVPLLDDRFHEGY